MMFGRSALFAFTVVMFLGCASKDDTKSVAGAADTGVAEDTAPVEDTAPWLTYPEGPYGLEKGMVFPNASFKGYLGGIDAKGRGEWSDIKMIDYYDPTGERGIFALLVVVSAEWCPPCREEAKDLPRFFTSLYQPRGARFLTTMIQDSKRNPADQPTVDRWTNQYQINFDIVADPDEQTIPAGSGIPRNYIINPRDMKIYRVNEGVNPDASIVPGLNPLLDFNMAPKVTTTTDAATGG